MQFFDKSIARHAGFSNVFEMTTIMTHTVCHHTNHPHLFFSCPSDTGNTRCICCHLFQVLGVLRTSCKSQIIPAIVRRITINVIDFIRRVFASHVEESKAMQLHLLILDTDPHVAILVPTVGNFPTSVGAEPGVFDPSPIPRFGIVMKALFQFGLRDHVRDSLRSTMTHQGCYSRRSASCGSGVPASGSARPCSCRCGSRTVG